MRSILILLLIFISCTKNSQTDLDNYKEEAPIGIEGISDDLKGLIWVYIISVY